MTGVVCSCDRTLSAECGLQDRCASLTLPQTYPTAVSGDTGPDRTGPLVAGARACRSARRLVKKVPHAGGGAGECVGWVVGLECVECCDGMFFAVFMSYTLG